MNPSTLFENSKREKKNGICVRQRKKKEKNIKKHKETYIKKKIVLKCTLALMSQTSTELNANLSIIDSLNQ